jgi:hypothetical protein
VPRRQTVISQLNTVNTAQRTPDCRHNVFSGRASEYLSDNIQRGTLRDRMAVTRGSSSTLEEEEEEEEEEENIIFVFTFILRDLYGYINKIIMILI